MDFKKLFEKYINNTVNDEEKEYIENEIEKNEIINEYLADKIDLQIKDTEYYHNEEAKQSNQTNNIKKAINKKFIRVTLISIISVLAILLCVNYVVSPIVNSVYYNPKDKTTGEYFTDFHFDLRTFTELNLPGYALVRTISEPLGFGEYDIYITQNNTFTDKHENTIAKIKRNSRIGFFEDFFKRNYFIFEDVSSGGETNFSTLFYEERLEDLEELNPTSYVSAYLEFSEDISIKDFTYLEENYNGLLEFKWVAIRVADKSDPVSHQVGFNPSMNDGSSIGDQADPNIYPYLDLMDYHDDFPGALSEEDFHEFISNAYETHFTSLLKYMYDHEEFVKAFDFNPNQTDFYKDSLEYIDENGIKTYGLLVYGEAENIYNFIQSENIKSINIDNVKVSKYSKE